MINIAKLLKDCPQGTKLYSPLLGEVEFAEVMDTDYVPIRVMCGSIGERFDEFGRYKGNEYPNAECLLFPSKDCRTWEGWKAPIEPKFQVGKWIAYNENKTSLPPKKIIGITGNRYIVSGNHVYDFKTLEADWHLWTIADVKNGDILIDEATNTIGIFKQIYGFHWDSEIYCGNSPWGTVFHSGGIHKIEDTKPATKEQRDLLFKKIKEAGYTWDANKKELCKVQSHYDIANFKPFDKVLCRGHNRQAWRPSLYGCYDTSGKYPMFVCATANYIQCIPFNDDTKHLLGTTDPCDEQYINW